MMSALTKRALQGGGIHIHTPSVELHPPLLDLRVKESVSRWRARRRAADRHPASARTQQPWHHVHLPAGRRQRRDHRDCARPTPTDDSHQRLAAALITAGGAARRAKRKRSASCAASTSSASPHQRVARLACFCLTLSRMLTAAALIRKGFFARELPPTFSSVALADVFDKAPSALQGAKRESECARHNLARPGGFRRPLRIPNPRSYIRLANVLEKHWTLIETHINSQSLAISKPAVTRTAETLSPPSLWPPRPPGSSGASVERTTVRSLLRRQPVL